MQSAYAHGGGLAEIYARGPLGESELPDPDERDLGRMDPENIPLAPRNIERSRQQYPSASLIEANRPDSQNFTEDFATGLRNDLGDSHDGVAS